jgi:hypothetical protein
VAWRSSPQSESVQPLSHSHHSDSDRGRALRCVALRGVAIVHIIALPPRGLWFAATCRPEAQGYAYNRYMSMLMSMLMCSILIFQYREYESSEFYY